MPHKPLEPPLTVGQVARLFGVSPNTVNRWAHKGKLPSLRTPGGQLRFPAHQVRLLAGASWTIPQSSAPPPEAGAP